jgi:four helix bundle protein
MEKELAFREWEHTLPERIQCDPLWKSEYYRLAMYFYDLSWNDCYVLRQDFRGREIVGQLIRSAGSICANLEEAYGRGVGTADYVRIVRIALGEAREAQGWYLRSRHLLPLDLLERRLNLIDHLISLLVRNITSHRRP